MKKVTILMVATLALAGVFVKVSAQAPAFKRTVLQQGDISVAGHEAVTALAEIPAGVAAGRHSHPGEEIGYVLEGSVLVEQDGKPAMTVEAGKTFLIPAGTIHNATNKGTTTTRILATYVVEKGKPLATPAPAAK